MTETPDLSTVRADIDRIDDAIHDLVMRRADLVDQVRRAKAADGGTAVRPGREAMILRRLLDRHSGILPPTAIARMWRELISAFLRLQGGFAVAVLAGPGDSRLCWDAARDHFGSDTPLVPVSSPLAALRAVSDGTASFAVLPFPYEADAASWWRALLSADPDAPRIFARLPFVIAGDRPASDDCVAIGPIQTEPTGDDRTLLAIELQQDFSRGRLKDVMAAHGLDAQSFRSWFDPNLPGVSIHLAEIADHATPSDPRMDALRSALGDALGRAAVIGTYATQIRLSAP